jgi:hypothetical protein
MMTSHLKRSESAPLARTKRPLAMAGALVCVAMASFAAGPAGAEDLFGTMLKGLGISSGDPIEYRERPPLVVPQSHDLPPPQSARGREPNVPADPKAGARAARSDKLNDLDRLAVPQQPAPTGAPENAADAPPSSPGLLGRIFSSSEAPKGAVPKNTPARKTLIQPPADYEQIARPGAPENPQPGASGL